MLRPASAVLERAADDPEIPRILEELGVVSAEASPEERRDYTSVFALLRDREAMPYLELAVLSHIEDERLDQIIGAFENRKLVRVFDRGRKIDEIITLDTSKIRHGYR